MTTLANLRSNRSMTRMREEGFTLIEMLIVACIIGTLAAIAVPYYFHQKAPANDAMVTANMQIVMSNVELKYREHPAAYISQEDFSPRIQIDDDTKFTVASNAEQGYCIALWNPTLSSKHKTADTALTYEPLGSGACAAFGITGTPFGGK